MSTRSSDPRGSGGNEKSIKGKEFERLAGIFYTENGFSILERNWRAGHREIDLIVRKDNLVVFVEVKSSFSHKFGHPAEKVDKKKIRNLSIAAEQYLVNHAVTDCDLRFDVITFANGQMEHFPNAFDVASP